METDDFLAHYGVTGMKWGRRKGTGGIKGMVKGAVLDSAQRRSTANKEIAAGRGQTRDYRRVALKRYGGLGTGAALATGNRAVAAGRAKSIDAFAERVKSGKMTRRDGLEAFMTTSMSDLVIRRTDKRTEPNAKQKKVNSGAKDVTKILAGVGGAVALAYLAKASKDPNLRAQGKAVFNQGVALGVNKQQGKNRAKSQKEAYRNSRADKFGLPSGRTYQARPDKNGNWG